MYERMPRISKRLFDRDFQRLSSLSTASLCGFGGLLLLIIAYAGWSSNTSATDRERQLLQHALNRSIARALNEQKSVAWWDDSVVKITDESIDLEFVDANFGFFLTETYGHDEVYILNAANKPLYSFRDGARGEPFAYESVRKHLDPLISEVRGTATTALKERPDTFGTDQKSYRTLSGALRHAVWAGHILSIDGRPAIATALSIDPNVDMSLIRPVPNVLVSVIYIDKEYVDSIGRTMLLSGLSLLPAPSTMDGIVSQLFEVDDGAAAGYFTWRTHRPGLVLLRVILPLVSLGLLAVAILARGMLGRLRDTSKDLADREAEARHAASHDALSGLPNRASFAGKLVTALRNLSTKRGDQRVVVAYLDLDRFKDVNDTLGHEAGDQLINAVASRLREHMRPGDNLFRYGGDEFAMLLLTPGELACQKLASRIESAFRFPFEIAGQSLMTTASIGIAVAPDHGTTAEDLMRHADIALYQSKSQGRNRATVFNEAMARQAEERRTIELDLRKALERNELRLAYQPIVSCRDHAIIGLEALLRWRHPERGELSPAAFIPVAEHSGLMPALGEWVLARAMTEAHNWPGLQISVNLSPVQFRQPDLEQRLREIAGKNSANPRQFVLEITEGVLMDSSDRTSHTLDAIREMGFSTALDDFGTGYSSLAYLCNFRFNKIKIDRTFVAGMARSNRITQIVKAVVAIGQGLGMEIVAEGVETEQDAKAMSDLGCSELQGYFFSKPLDVEPLKAFLAARRPKGAASAPPYALESKPVTAVG